jgi:hypothetical protein
VKNNLWTFETLAKADRATLDQVLLSSNTPDPKQMVGYVYDGYNHDWLGQLAGKKFRKTFLLQDNQPYGLNQIVEQDGNDFTGEWRIRHKNGRPVELGFFKVLPASESAWNRQVARYKHLICFDYNIALNPKTNLLMRSIHDYVGLPNVGDYGIVLGKAYLQITPSHSIFASYFILGHRKPYE